MDSNSSPVPSLEELRALARAQGVDPSDDDLRAAAGFLATILPELRTIEEWSAGTSAAGPVWPEEDQA
jgi:hypothetical protein